MLILTHSINFQKKIEDIIDDSSLDIDDVEKKFETIDNKVKFKLLKKLRLKMMID